MLRAFVAQRPDDPFPRYGLALELRNAGDLEAAWGAFAELLEAHPGYTPTYLHAGNTLVALGRRAQARDIYRRGVEACRKAGDGKTAGELEGALAELGPA